MPPRRANRAARPRAVSWRQRLQQLPTVLKDVFLSMVQPRASVKGEAERHKAMLITSLSVAMFATNMTAALIGYVFDVLPYSRVRYLTAALGAVVSYNLGRTLRVKYSLRLCVYGLYVAGFYRSCGLALAGNIRALIPSHLAFLFVGVLSASLALTLVDVAALGLLGFVGTLGMNTVLGLGVEQDLIHELAAVHGTLGMLVCMVCVLHQWSYGKIDNQARELVRTRDAAVHSARVKSMFVATVGHEVRTPLNGVISLSTLLSRSALDEEQQDWVRNIRLCGRMLLSLSSNILEYARAEADRLQLLPIDFDLVEAVEETMLVCETGAKPAVEMLWHVDSDVPPRVLGDGIRLQQILINLLSNATRFTETGEIVLRVSVRQPAGEVLPETPGSPIWLEFAVKDTGCGLSEADQKRLFVPLDEREPITNLNVGLGLAMSRVRVLLCDVLAGGGARERDGGCARGSWLGIGKGDD